MNTEKVTVPFLPPLNGVASSQGFAQRIEPIWKVDKTYPGGVTTRVNIHPMTSRALELCD